jgi:hypothetical protein
MHNPWPTLLSIVLALVMGKAGRAQDDYRIPPKPPEPPSIWGSAYMMGGTSAVDGRDLLIGDARVLASGSVLLPPSLAGYNQAWTWWSAPGSGAFNASIGIHPFRGEEKRGPELRLGIQTTGGQVGVLEYERILRYPVDTLYSPSTGAMFIIDSLFTSRLTIAHSAQRFGLESSLIFRTRGKSRWSLFGGVGFGIGTRYNVETSVVLWEDGYVNYPGAPQRFDNSTLQREVFSNSGGAWVSFCTPFGFSFQMARKGNFLRWVDLFMEFRPGLLIQGTREFGSVTKSGSQTLFGIRVRVGR